jgi:hypothetical protein
MGKGACGLSGLDSCGKFSLRLRDRVFRLRLCTGAFVGLVFLSHRDFDADYCWYSTLEDAHKDSRLLEEHQEKLAGEGF